MNGNKIRINLNNIDDIKKFIKVATSFVSDIDVITERTVVDGKSILALLSLDLSQDIYVRIISYPIKYCQLFFSTVFQPIIIITLLKNLQNQLFSVKILKDNAVTKRVAYDLFQREMCRG